MSWLKYRLYAYILPGHCQSLWRNLSELEFGFSHSLQACLTTGINQVFSQKFRINLSTAKRHRVPDYQKNMQSSIISLVTEVVPFRPIQTCFFPKQKHGDNFFHVCFFLFLELGIFSWNWENTYFLPMGTRRNTSCKTEKNHLQYVCNIHAKYQRIHWMPQEEFISKSRRHNSIYALVKNRLS